MVPPEQCMENNQKDLPNIYDARKMKQKYLFEYNSTIISEEEIINKKNKSSVLSLPKIDIHIYHKYANPEKNIHLAPRVAKRLKEISEEVLAIHHYLEKYENQELSIQVKECVRTVKKNYEESVTNRKWTNNLMHIMGSVDKKKNIEQSLALNDDYFLGSGGYGVVIKKSRSDFSKVMKISFGMRSEPLDNPIPYYNPIDEREMPFEYCVGLHSPTTHILKPLANSFQPIELPTTVFRKEFQTRRGTLTFYNPVSQPKIDNLFGSKTIIEPVVPMFEMALCRRVMWTEDEFDMKPHKKFVELLRAVDDIHKSGIGLMDISPNNIMNCNGEFKFLDLGFAELYRYADMPIIVFGLEFYRSPWAHIASELDIEDNQELHLGRKLFLEAIANDYWSLAFIFGRKLCGLGKHLVFKALIDDIIESKSINYGGYSTLSVVEINECLQSHLELMFSQLRINHHPSPAKRALCSKTLQEMLQSILQVNPIIRMQNVEKMLSTY